MNYKSETQETSQDSEKQEQHCAHVQSIVGLPLRKGDKVK